MSGLPPVARLALSFAAGAAFAPHLGRLALAPFLLLLLLPPIRAWLRPMRRRALIVGVLAGVFAGVGAGEEVSVRTPDGGRTSCVRPGPAGSEVRVHGHFVAVSPSGTSPFFARSPSCSEQIRVVPPDDASNNSLVAGDAVLVLGRWRDGRYGSFVVADSVRGDPSAGFSVRATLARWRGSLVRRIDDMYGPRARLVSALTLARKEGLDPDLREAFARSGLAHLLAISGFHVGVVALLLLTLVRRVRLPRRRAALVAALGTWAYVALLGFPDAACRAAVIISAVAASTVRGRPVARWGPLGAALLILVAFDPARLSSPGFQLSFAGAAGLVFWAPGIRRTVLNTIPWCPRALASAVAAGCAATLATLPVVTWHFERVSLVGIPATLLASPLVALALPGALASMVADRVHPAAGHFLAGGVDVLLALLEGLTRAFAAPAWASVWLPRTWVPLACFGAGVAAFAATRRGIGARTRRGVAAFGAVTVIVVWPVLLSVQAHGTLEVLAVDVGQGDAIALRTPGGHWILVDTGPAPRGAPGSDPVVRALRREGVHRIELIVLTHPHLDHIGGAEAVLDAFDVGAVLDPARATASEAYVHVLGAAASRGVPWTRAERGERFDVDGVVFEVLSSGSLDDVMAVNPDGANEISVVLAVHYGLLDVLLTGDAPVSVERAVLDQVPHSLEILKVGHHGSSTSTDSLLLATARPQAALVSVGRGNRYGHPSPAVIARLRRFGVEVYRTDREGTLRVLGRRDGSFRVETEGGGGR